MGTSYKVDVVIADPKAKPLRKASEAPKKPATGSSKPAEKPAPAVTTS